MKWRLAVAALLVLLYLRRARRTQEQRLRAAYLEGDRENLDEHLPGPKDFNAEG